MAVMLTLDREVMQIICAYGPQSERPDTEKVRFHDEMGSEWDFGSSSKVFLWEILMDMWKNVLRVLKVYKGGNGIEKEMQKEEDCWSFVMKGSCVWQTFGFISHTKGKSLIVPVDMKQKLVLCLWEKNTESLLGFAKVLTCLVFLGFELIENEVMRFTDKTSYLHCFRCYISL